METKWKVFAILLIGLLSIGFFFFSKGANGMDQSETSTEMIKKVSMSQTPVAKRKQMKRLIQRIIVKFIWLVVASGA